MGVLLAGLMKKNRDSRADSELMVALCRGEEDAFSEIMDRFSKPVYSLLLRMLGNEDDAEELLQVTFCRVYRYRANYDPERPLVTWIFTIASNLAKKEWRRRSRWNSVPLENAVVSTQEVDSPHDREGSRDLQLKLERAISLLPHHYREPFLLREKEGLSYDEISEILNIRIGTVKSRINRARTALRDTLQDVWEHWR
ncbi:MAG: sigma-70 family RNA polymerase sigma factor [Candidatus Fermentibacteraceae bacterium]